MLCNNRINIITVENKICTLFAASDQLFLQSLVIPGSRRSYKCNYLMLYSMVQPIDYYSDPLPKTSSGHTAVFLSRTRLVQYFYDNQDFSIHGCFLKSLVRSSAPSVERTILPGRLGKREASSFTSLCSIIASTSPNGLFKHSFVVCIV